MEVQGVATMLKNRGERATAKAVEAWFKKAQVQLTKGGQAVSDDAQLNAKTIELHLRVSGRVEKNKDTLLSMESQLGGKHPLTTLKSLDMLCRTPCSWWG